MTNSSSRTFRIEDEVTQGLITYRLFGDINENAEFPLALFSPTIKIDLSRVTGLNSVGTRSWCRWVQGMTPPTLVRLEGVPTIMAKSFNQITGAYTGNMQMVSVIVPYYSEESGQRKDLEYLLGRDYDRQGKILSPEEITVDGEVYVRDVFANFLGFLKK